MPGRPERMITLAVDFREALYERRFAFAMGLMMVAAFTMRAWGANYGFPLLFPKDEGQLIPAAVRFGSGDLNPHSFTYPSLFKYILFACYGAYFIIGKLTGLFASVHAFKLHYFVAPTDFYLIARLVSAAMGASTVLAVYLVGKVAHSRRVGLVAAAFAALEYYNLYYSHIAKPDATMVALLMFSLYFSVRIVRKGELWDYVWAGVLGGLAISSKYNALFCTVAITVAHFSRVGTGSFKKKLTSDFHLLVTGNLLVIVFFFVGTPFALIEYRTFLRDLEFVRLVVTRGDSGHGYLATVAFYIKDLFLPDGWRLDSNYLGVFALLGWFLLIFKRQRRDWPLLVFTLTHFVYFTYKASASLLKPHYLLPIMPIMMIFAARLLVMLFDRMSGSDRRKDILIAAAAVLLCVAPIEDMVRFNYGRSQEVTGNLARKWFDANVPSGTRVLQVGLYDLALRESRESLRDNNHGKPDDVLQMKEEAADTYDGKIFYVGYINPGWNVTKETIAALDEMPLGVELPKTEATKLQYWTGRGFDYAAVIVRRLQPKKFAECVDERFRQLVQELETSAGLIAEFVPEPPHRPGWWIRIYRL